MLFRSTTNLVSTAPVSATPSVATILGNSSATTQDFLTLLLSVKSISLDKDVAIFSDNAFIGLHDSSIILVPDGTEGRVNPFAPLGTDATTPVNTGTTGSSVLP